MAIKKSTNDINARMFYALRVSEESRVPFLFISAPGMGKSTTVEMFAKIQGYELVILRGNSTSPEEVMGYDTVQAGVATAVHLRPTWYDALLNNEKDGKKTLLFLDEITTCPSHVQAALLHLILERKVGNEKIPESTLIVSAGNYSQSLGSTFDLLAPLMNRFCIFNVVPNPSDIHMFLTKYEGAATGKITNLIKAKTEMLRQMNTKSITADEETRNKISEYIERGFNDVVDALMNSGNKVLDPKVTDLQGIYQDTDNDSTLKGFITPRTLCFLRDATISAYFAFGKEGITGKNYHLLVEGLCGIGLSRNNSGEVVVTEVSKEFESQMKLVITEIDKMSNDKLPIYNKFFMDLIDQNKDKKGNPKFSHESVTTAYNKLKEMLNDKDISGIERPLETQTLEPLMQGVQSYMADISNISVDSNSKIEDSITPEKLASVITQWNSCGLLFGMIRGMVRDDKYGYSDASKQNLNNTLDKLRKYGFSINIVDRYMRQRKPDVVKLIPELNTKFYE